MAPEVVKGSRTKDKGTEKRVFFGGSKEVPGMEFRKKNETYFMQKRGYSIGIVI